MNFVDLKTQYERIQVDVQARIQAFLSHGRYVMGPEITALEERLAAMVGVRHTIAVASGRTPGEMLRAENPDYFFDSLADTDRVLHAIVA